MLVQPTRLQRHELLEKGMALVTPHCLHCS